MGDEFLGVYFAGVGGSVRFQKPVSTPLFYTTSLILEIGRNKVCAEFLKMDIFSLRRCILKLGERPKILAMSGEKSILSGGLDGQSDL